MVDAATRAAPRAERVRILWDFEVRQVEMHERRCLQLMALALGGALAVLASVLLEKVPVSLGLAFAAALFLVGLYLQVPLARMPAQLRRAWYATVALIDRLMAKEGD